MPSKKPQKIPVPVISRRLHELREQRGLTQDALAKRAGLTSQAVNQVENGKRKPAFDTLVALARGLEVSLDFLVGLPVADCPGSLAEAPELVMLAERVGRMPPELQAEVRDFVDFLWEKRISRKKRRKA